jgi:hypothetical protein
MNLNLLELYFQGNSYGHVLTEAQPTADGGRLFRVELAGLENLAQLAADVLGFEQPYLPRYGAGNLARWLVRYGCEKWEAKFAQATARALIWTPPAARVVTLCEMCGKEVVGMAVLWRRGFTAVCCVSCAGELTEMMRHIRLDAKGAKGLAMSLLANKRPSWSEVTESILDEHRPLREALAKV